MRGSPCPRCGRPPETVRSARGPWVTRCPVRLCLYMGVRVEGPDRDSSRAAWERMAAGGSGDRPDADDGGEGKRR